MKHLYHILIKKTIDKSCTALELSVKEILESFNMFNGTNSTLNSDMALGPELQCRITCFQRCLGDLQCALVRCENLQHVITNNVAF